MISSKLGCLQRPGDGVATTFGDVCELADWGGIAGAELFRVGVMDDTVCRIRELVEEDMAWEESAVSDYHMYLGKNGFSLTNTISSIKDIASTEQFRRASA